MQDVNTQLLEDLLRNIFSSYIVLEMKDIQKFLLISCITLFTIWFSSLFPIYSPEPVNIDIETHAERVLHNMSVEEKVGQLFIFGFWGVQPTEDIIKMIQERGIGSVIMMGYNIESESQIKQLISYLQSISKYPLFISIDQEGGVVARVKFEDTYSIAQYEIQNEKQAFDIGKRRGESLKGLGFNLNYSPVLDNILNSDSFLFSRSFRNSQHESANLAISMINGYHSGGILASIKHFPGHADATFDSHEGLDSVNITEDMLDSYIYQFKEPLKYSDAVMVGHILFPLIDSENPASVSKYFLTTLLRERLHFRGLIITDDMQMKSIYDRYTVEDASVKALQAGNDLVMYIGRADEQIRVYDSVLSAVRSGEISEEELDMKVLRILQYKYSL